MAEAVFRRRREPRYRIFFATDVHGSDRCFGKFLSAARVYSADTLILGGDIVGKAMVPLVRDNGSYISRDDSTERRIDPADLDEEIARIRLHGLYPLVIEPDEYERLRDDGAYRAGLFEETMCAQISRWCDQVAERLDRAKTRCIITPGNDDPIVLDDVLRTAEAVNCPEREVVEVGPVWLASLGNTNRTPWDTEREYDEPVLARQIEEMLEPGGADRPLVFNFHCPPASSGLDTVVKLDAELRPVLQGGRPVEMAAGSMAVREAIERYGPVCGLHGHIHESAGVYRLGPSWCFNPGSEYSSGILNGLIVNFAPDGSYMSHLLTAG